MDSFMIGECTREDESLSSCSGGCNQRDIGGSCKQNHCIKNNASRMELQCFRDDDEKCTKLRVDGTAPLLGNSCKSNHLKKLILRFVKKHKIAITFVLFATISSLH